MTDAENEAVTPESEFENAQKEFAAGNVEQSLTHLSYALSHDPEDEDFLELLDTIIEKTDEPELLLPLKSNADLEMLATKAYILAKLEKFDDALHILFQIAMVRPDIQYLCWVNSWEKSDNFYKVITANKICTYITESVLNLPDISYENYIIKELWEDVLTIVENARVAYPDDEYLAFVHSLASRRALQYEESLVIAEKAYEKFPSYMTSLAVANANRDLGKIKEALEYFSKCLDFRQDDIAVRLDMADMLCQEGHETEGIRIYEEILDDEPENAWALTSMYYYKFVTTDDQQWRNKLERFALENPENERAAVMVDAMTPYVGFLPELAEATVNSMQDIAEKFEREPDDNFGGKININLSYPECPSSRLAAEVMLEMMELDLQLIFSSQKVAKPDPREERGNPEYRIWVYKEGHPKAVVEPPSDEISEQIAGIAITGFNIHNWREIAKVVAEELGTDTLKSLLGVMAHPPMPHPDFDAWDWVFRCQLAAALIIAYIDDGWEDSVRKQVLFSLLHGPADWSTNAAIVALTELALDIPEIRGEIVDEFAELLEMRPDAGYWCLEYPLVTCILRIPGLDDKTREFFEKYRTDLERS